MYILLLAMTVIFYSLPPPFFSSSHKSKYHKENQNTLHYANMWQQIISDFFPYLDLQVKNQIEAFICIPWIIPVQLSISLQLNQI